jgi:hypothetical protein
VIERCHQTLPLLLCLTVCQRVNMSTPYARRPEMEDQGTVAYGVAEGPPPETGESVQRSTPERLGRRVHTRRRKYPTRTGTCIVSTVGGNDRSRSPASSGDFAIWYGTGKATKLAAMWHCCDCPPEGPEATWTDGLLLLCSIGLQNHFSFKVRLCAIILT